MAKKYTIQAEDSALGKSVQARLVSELDVCRIEELHIDRESYQRQVVMSRVKEIGAAYDMDVAGIITVNRRSNGLLYIVDGQHRTLGAKRAGELEMLAQVYQGLTVEQEAWLFERKNATHGPMSATNRYKARLKHGEPIAVAMQEAAHAVGTHINTAKHSHKGINAVTAVEWVYTTRGGGSEGVSMMLAVLKDAYEEVGGKAAHGDLIKGLWHFMERHEGKYDRKRLVTKLRLASPEMIQLSAADFRRAYGETDSGYTHWYRAVLKQYNSGRQDPSKRLPE
jgi:hypothetical protein